MPHADPDVAREYFRQYNERRRERLRAYHRERYQRNKEAILKKNREWVRRNRERSNASYYKRVKKAHREQPITRLIQACRRRAKDRGIECDLTLEWAKSRWTGVCEMTGIQFVVSDKSATAFSPSIDRIDNSKGYLQGNCRFVLWAINRFKMADTDDEMIMIATALVERYGRAR